jgi:hypothetical protein
VRLNGVVELRTELRGSATDGDGSEHPSGNCKGNDCLFPL